MVGVTWGQNQTRTFSGSSPASTTTAAPAPAFGFGTPAPAPGSSLFGSTTTTTTPAPAPSGGLFGSTTPAPAPLFGTPAPAPTTGLFGTPSPAPSTGLFGTTTPAPSPFGTTTPAPSPFGTTTQQQQQQQQPAGPQIPAHAAMAAHLDATARQEAAKFQAALEKYHKAYTGTDKNKFVTIVYTDITPAHRQQQWLLRSGQVVAPPCPPTVSEKEWLEAVVRNPDPELYMPMALVGASELQTRVAWQQDRANAFQKHLQGLELARTTLSQKCTRITTDLQVLSRLHSNLRNRLLEIMRKVELVRCMNLPLQQDEVKLKERLVVLQKQVYDLNKLLATVEQKAKHSAEISTSTQVLIVNVPPTQELSRVLKGHRETITKMTAVLEHDSKDLALLRTHVVPQVPLPPTSTTTTLQHYR